MKYDVYPARVIFHPGREYCKETRLWQGCPSIACTGKRLWVAVYTGNTHEPMPDNYAAILTSEDGGHTWQDPYMIIDAQPNKPSRVIDAQLWYDPRGRLWIFWGQSMLEETQQAVPYHDGVFGVWAICSENPEAETPEFTQPKRICDGFARNDPLVLQNGNWLLCAYDWAHSDYIYYLSRDEGESWERQEGPLKPADYRPTPDETMLVEKKDGTLWMLARTPHGIAQAFCQNGMWSAVEQRAIANPSSRFYISRLDEGPLLLLNHVGFSKRDHLCAQLSYDDGRTWPQTLLLDSRDGVAYPDLTRGPDGRFYMIYDRKRNTKGEIILMDFTFRDLLDGRAPSPRVISKTERGNEI